MDARSIIVRVRPYKMASLSQVDDSVSANPQIRKSANSHSSHANSTILLYRKTNFATSSFCSSAFLQLIASLQQHRHAHRRKKQQHTRHATCSSRRQSLAISHIFSHIERHLCTMSCLFDSSDGSRERERAKCFFRERFRQWDTVYLIKQKLSTLQDTGHTHLLPTRCGIFVEILGALYLPTTTTTTTPILTIHREPHCQNRSKLSIFFFTKHAHTAAAAMAVLFVGALLVA